MVGASIIAELEAMSAPLAEIQHELLASDGVNLNVEISDLNTTKPGVPDVLIRGDVTGLVHVALWSLACASSEVAGKHAHIDEFGIADVGSTPLVIALESGAP